MRLKVVSILIGSLILSTALTVIESQEALASMPPLHAKTTEHKLGEKQLENLQKIHQYNEVFDNYHTGSIPYEPYK